MLELFKQTLEFNVKQSIKYIAVATLGSVLIIAGIVMLVIPGPGLLSIFIGLGVLATEFQWAKHLKSKFKEKFERFQNRTK